MDFRFIPNRNLQVSSSGRVILIAAIMFWGLTIGSAPAIGQDTTKKASESTSNVTVPGLTVTSNPEGALVELKGVAELAGLSPVYFSQGIPGRYKLKVSKTGYETYSTTIVISGDRVEQVDVRLDPKTRGKAAIRSLLLPGWGQFYSGQKTKGGVMTVLALSAGAAVVFAEIDYQDKRDNFDIVNDSYLNAVGSGSIENLSVLFRQVELAQADAHDAESTRRAAFGGAIAVWTISFLDALFFFPNSNGQVTTRKIVITPESDFIKGYAGLKASFSF